MLSIFYNYRLLIYRLSICLLVFLLFILAISSLLDYLRPNTIMIDLADQQYEGQVEITIDTGEGFLFEAIEPGQVHDDLMDNVHSLMIVFTEPDVSIKGISMERFFAPLDIYLPIDYKSWSAETILEDFIIAGSSDHYYSKNGIIYFSSNLPLMYRGDFSRTYNEIDSNMAVYKYIFYLVAALLAGFTFFLSGLILAKWQKIKPLLYKKGSLLHYNNILLILFILFITLIVLAPADSFILPLIIPAIIFGLLIVYFNREKLNNLEYHVIELKPKLIIFILVVLILIGGIVFAYKVGEHDFRGDEFQVMEAAAGYYYTGDYYIWDFLEGKPGEHYMGESYYDRAYPHTFLIAQSYKLFGITEWSTRLVSVICGILFILILFFTARYFAGNETLALLAVYVAIFNETFIFIFRYTRMYVLLIPLFLVLSVLAYKSITGTSLKSEKQGKLYQMAYNNINYNYYYAALSLSLLWFIYQVHINVLVIGPAILLYVIGMSFVTREKKYIFLATAGIILASITFYAGILNRYGGHISFFESRNYDYIESILGYPFSWGIGVVLFVVGFYAAINLKDSIKHKMFYLYSIVGFALFFFIFIADRYHHFLYASHVRPLAIVIILFSCFLLLKVLNIKWLNYAFIALLIFIIGFDYYHDLDRNYGDRVGYGKFSIAYQEIVNNYDPEREVIFGQFLREYYLQDLQGKEVERVNMLWYQKYSFNDFISDIEHYDAGWVTLETRHRHVHLEPAIVDYLDYHFEKIHGEGVDDTRVEVFYYDNSNTR